MSVGPVVLGEYRRNGSRRCRCRWHRRASLDTHCNRSRQYYSESSILNLAVGIVHMVVVAVDNVIRTDQIRTVVDVEVRRAKPPVRSLAVGIICIDVTTHGTIRPHKKRTEVVAGRRAIILRRNSILK